MKKYGKRWFSALMALLFALIVLVPAASAATPEMADPARSLNFDGGWKFHLGDADGAQAMDYADGAWRDVTLPHDYSIEQDFTPTAQGESGYLPGGIGWYRKTFTAPVDYAGKHITLDFDGAYMNTEVYVNGTKVGTNPYGYNPFSFDITDLVRPGQKRGGCEDQQQDTVQPVVLRQRHFPRRLADRDESAAHCEKWRTDYDAGPCERQRPHRCQNHCGERHIEGPDH